MIQISEEERRRAFSTWLRTGYWPAARGADGIEHKFNPWHDPRDGRFTFANTGNYHGRGWGDGGFSGGGGGRSGGGGATARGWETTEELKRRERVVRSQASGAIKTVPRIATSPATSPAKPAEPRTHITRNGYDYELDANARVRTTSGYLGSTQTPLRSRTAQARAGGSDRRRSDDGGHYIAARFNGPTDAFNHFAQDANFNRGGYRALEDQWGREQKANKRVFVKIVPTYAGKSQRPSMLNIWFIVEGHTESVQFPNERGKTRHGK